MTKQEMRTRLEQMFKVDNPALHAAAIDFFLTDFPEDENEWNQLGAVKKQVDALWMLIKKFAEQKIVKARSDEVGKTLDRLRPKT